ncbi:hypothetical protein DERP_001808 [Dermatophagoides pteronyssinus]|uniref:Uncharacterized protein n=1 Tax=Dermatophagoides pteronyssinus TaxID=6956 RepID=A0ABQ8JBJ0_DERPT|nr:hypothetical protein DERP_001808 [Dermatophagoides pteronyssinus]
MFCLKIEQMNYVFLGSNMRQLIQTKGCIFFISEKLVHLHYVTIDNISHNYGTELFSDFTFD